MKTTDEVVGRPRCRRAKQRDEHASFHSITSSARASSVGPLGVDSWGDDAKVYLGQLTFREDASDDRLSPTLLAKTSSGSCPASRRRSRKFCVAATFRERTAASSLFKSAGLRSFPLGVALREPPGIFLRRLSLRLPCAEPSWHLKAVPMVGYPTQEMKIERFTGGSRVGWPVPPNASQASSLRFSAARIISAWIAS